MKTAIVEYWGDNNGYDAGCHYEDGEEDDESDMDHTGYVLCIGR